MPGDEVRADMCARFHVMRYGEKTFDALFKATNTTREQIVEYLDCEFSVGRVRGGSVPWEIELSTLPWREGRPDFVEKTHSARRRSAADLKARGVNIVSSDDMTARAGFLRVSGVSLRHKRLRLFATLHKFGPSTRGGCAALQRCQQRLSIRRAEAGAGIPSGAGGEGSVVAAGDVEKRRFSQWVNLRVEETNILAQMLVEQGDQACPEWGYGAGTTDDFLLAVD